jgi:hypothetical protein
MEDLRYFYSTVAKAESQLGKSKFLCKSYKRPKRPPVRGRRWYNPGEVIDAEGGNRTLIPGGNTILSRARLPIPPLRLLG